MKLLIILLLSISCSDDSSNDNVTTTIDIPVNKIKDPRTTTKTNSVFLPTIRKFEREFGVEVTDVPISFGVLQGGILGVCYTYKFTLSSKSYREIIIDKVKYNELLASTYYGKEKAESLIYHELGHCELNSEHRNHTYNFIWKFFYQDRDCTHTTTSTGDCTGRYKYAKSKQPRSIMRWVSFSSPEMDYFVKNRGIYIKELAGNGT